MQGIIYFFQHLPFNLAGGEQDLQEQREGLALIVNMLEPWTVAGGFSSPPYWFQQMAEPEREFFRWLDAQMNSSGELATASLNIHSQRQHTKRYAHTDKTQKNHNKSTTAQISEHSIKPYPKKKTFTSFPCLLKYWTVSNNAFHSLLRLIIQIRIILIIHSEVIG